MKPKKTPSWGAGGYKRNGMKNQLDKLNIHYPLQTVKYKKAFCFFVLIKEEFHGN
ncbi:hypothetical protein FACS189485_18120 [Spirochaetia bacterium]|nr:hypothetical protein FACS189485_18120 [Spirochaetia bacterium]